MLELPSQSGTHVYQRHVAAWWRKSWIGSTVGHFALIVFLATDLAALLLLFLGLSQPPPGKREPVVLEVHLEEEPKEPLVPEMLIAVEPYDEQEAFAAAKAVAGELDFSDPALQQPLDYDYQSADADDHPTREMQRFIEENLRAAIVQSNEQSTEENLERLDELASQLERTSSAESIDAVTGTIGRLLGTSERATRPAEGPVAGAFDSNTGQIDDVIRKPREPEGYVYVAILIDAEGRQTEVELEGPEAKQAYDTFEKIKRYPFLDKIYRSVVMSLLDGMMQK